MDITPKQFNSLLGELKKIRDHLEELRQDFNQQSDATRDAERQEQLRNRLPIPFEVKLEEDQEEKRGAEERRQYKVQNSIRKATWAAFVAASIYAGITAYYTQVARRTLDQIKKQTPAIEQSGNAARNAAVSASQAITQAEQHFRVEERPWIIAFPDFLPQGFFAPRSDGTFALGAVVQEKNIGKTPAVQTQNAPYEIIVGPPQDARRKAMNFVPDYGKSGYFTMNPDITMTPAIHHLEDSHLTADQVQKLMRGEFSLYIVGATRYEDVFPPPIAQYETPYCFAYSSKGLPLSSCPFGGRIR